MVSGTNSNRPRDKRDYGTPPWDRLGPVPGTNWPFSANSTVTLPFRLACPWLGQVGVRPWDDCPTRAVRQMFMGFLFIVFIRPLPPKHFLELSKSL